MSDAISSQAVSAAGFGTLMRQWRRRRGLSQLDLAENGGVSQRHVSFLESGRARPSRQMVLHLAELLDMPLRERNRLLHAAGFAAAYRESKLDAPQLAEARHALDLLLKQHEPFPAVVVDAAWTVQLANQAAQRMIGFLLGPLNESGHDPAKPVNFMKLPLHPQGARPFIKNWRDVAGNLLHRLQREAMDSPAAAAVLSEVRGYPDVDALWRSVDWEAEPRPLLSFSVEKDGLALDLVTMIATFGTPQDVTLQDLRIESFLPANAASEALLRGLATH
ncbi:helix-turn-helix transcriptional regulator [Ferrovibrio sp.]|uniref:helix-turn-helix domain-containing protein n=1 Tax=Ferrovibrio sp. TaxID=1917215 RepID=UPI000CC537D9|nr:helix-turn-helix transcriptional regulator [Ferrovibrio sp.]PJI39510.1 MAG: transcriptional regulator [Ferrovibrio sp.]